MWLWWEISHGRRLLFFTFFFGCCSFLKANRWRFIWSTNNCVTQGGSYVVLLPCSHPLGTPSFILLTICFTFIKTHETSKKKNEATIHAVNTDQLGCCCCCFLNGKLFFFPPACSGMLCGTHERTTPRAYKQCLSGPVPESFQWNVCIQQSSLECRITLYFIIPRRGWGPKWNYFWWSLLRGDATTTTTTTATHRFICLPII